MKNIVWICIDCLRQDVLDAVDFPAISKLRNASLRFRNCMTAGTTTLISFASLFTACYPRKTRLRCHRLDKMDKQLTTLARHLSRLGYMTKYYSVDPVLIAIGPEILDGFGEIHRHEEVQIGKTGNFIFLHLWEVHTTVIPSVSSQIENLRLIDAKLAKLDAAGIFDDAIVVLTSDHGDATGMKEDGGPGNIWHGYDFSRAVVNIPFWLSGGEGAGSDDDRWLSSVDIAPLILQTLGLPALAGSDGNAQNKPYVFSEAWRPAYQHNGVTFDETKQVSLLTPDYTLVYNFFTSSYSVIFTNLDKFTGVGHKEEFQKYIDEYEACRKQPGFKSADDGVAQ